MSDFDFLTPEFIRKECKPLHIKCNREIFPWKYLGWSDVDFVAEDLHFSHGPAIPVKQKRILLGVIREEEQKLLAIHKYVTWRNAVMGLERTTGKQLRLF